jgi:hypothetical protein
MKRVLLASLFVLLFIKSYGVSLDSFYRPGVRWAIARYQLGSQWTPSTHTGRVYEVAGDSTIGAFTYHLIYYNSDFGHDQGLHGGIRIDSGRVYFINLSPDTLFVRANYAPTLSFAFFAPGSEHQLYDYNVHVGDTLHWKPLVYNVVKKIDSIKIDGTWLKRIHFLTGTFPMEDYWIEGIGSNLSFFGAYDSANQMSIGGGVLQHTFRYCAPKYSYEFPQVATYAASFGTGCNLKPVSVENLLEEQMDLTVAPNPSADGTVHLEAAGNRRIYQVTVTDLAGRLVIQQDHVGNKRTTIKVTPGAGTYFVRVALDNAAVITRRLVIR